MDFESPTSDHFSYLFTIPITVDPKFLNIEIDQNVSMVSSIPEVRSFLVKRQRHLVRSLVGRQRNQYTRQRILVKTQFFLVYSTHKLTHKLCTNTLKDSCDFGHLF